MTQYHIVWNSDRSEGFITSDIDDAIAASGNHRNRPSIESTFGAAFRETYEDDKRIIQQVEIYPELSKRAVSLLARIKRGEFYFTDSENTPKAMQELLDRNLVTTMGRVVELRRSYVAYGHAPFVMDVAPGE